jgi:hypothetical protein
MAPGGEVVLEVNGWTVTIKQSRARFGMAALTLKQGPRVMHLELNESQMTAFDPDAFWRAGV